MKSGLDWFRIDTFFEDKFEMLCSEFKSVGFEIIVRLWQKIYRETGYYLEWNEDVALLFMKKELGRIGSEGSNVVSEVVKCAIRRGIFSQELYERYGILTSSGMQKWYIDATERRKEVELIGEYLLFDVRKYNQNANIILKNVNINAENVSKTKHSTVQDSIVKKSVAHARSAASRADFETRMIDESLLQECTRDKLKEWIAYKKEKRSGYKETGLKSLIKDAERTEQHCGAESVCSEIDKSMRNNWQGIFFENCKQTRREGVMDGWS